MATDYLLRVGLWQVATGVSTDRLTSLLSNAVGDLTHERRCDFLEEAVQDAVHHFGPAPPGTTPVNVFVVPEYYFANSRDLHFVDEHTKNQTVERLKSISKISNTLLVPGTVAWIKPFVRPGAFGNAFRTSRYKRATKRIRETHALLKPGTRQPTGTLSRLAQAKADNALDECYMAENTAFILRGGKTLLKYHKRSNGCEINDADGSPEKKLFWIPGPRSGEFTVEKMKFGVEICAEHGAGTMGKHASGLLDVHIIIASSMRLNLGNVHVADGGLVLYCDSNELPEVHQRDGGGFRKIDQSVERLKPVLTQDQIADQMISVREQSIAKNKSKEDVSRFVFDIALTRLSGRLHYYQIPFSK